jgi:hypothetical protein
MTVVSLFGVLVVAMAGASCQEDSVPAVTWEREYYPEQIDHQLYGDEIMEPVCLTVVEGLRAVDVETTSKPADIPLAA